MTVFSEQLNKREEGKPMGKFLKAEDLKDATLIIESIGVIKANDPKFGATEKDSLFRSGILKSGETIEYKFRDLDGNELTYNNKSAALYIAFRGSDVERGDKVRITRTGKMEETRYNIEKLN